MRTALLAAILFGTLTGPATPQSRPDVAVHKTAMGKLGFLAGAWTGQATVTLGPGKPIAITQTERIEYKLDGTVLLVEGTGRDAGGVVVFSALATIAFDAPSNGYRIRAYREGHDVDAELTLLDQGFEWSFTSGPVKVTNRMHVDSSGRWSEVTDTQLPDGRQIRSVDMLLARQ